MKLKTFIVDAFTSEPFRGNPAAVCFLDSPIDEHTMQLIAAELNLSETAFLTPGSSDGRKFNIRYFTPTVEIAFCGHATLASSKLVLHKLNKPFVDFTTHFGLQITAQQDGDEIKMTFPVFETVSYQVPPALYDAFGINEPLEARFTHQQNMLLIEVASNEVLQSLNPDYTKAVASSSEVRQVIVTAKGDSVYDFYSRCFCPWIGINEDPVTGASHSILAPYWAEKLSKTQMLAWQSSKRGGYLRLKNVDDATLEVKSSARIVFEGVMEI